MTENKLPLTLLAFALVLTVATRGYSQQEPVKQNDPRLQAIYLKEANRWDMWLDESHQRKAEIVAEPIFRWQNLSKANGQSGAMFIWTHENLPVVVGGVFSNPENNRRVIIHEFHALGPDRLYPKLQESDGKWNPSTGITLKPLPDSPAVEDTLPKRTLQLRAIARDFSAYAIDEVPQRWELRLLPKPLYRYDKSHGDVVDGALLAFVSDAGIDPEILLILEARKANGGLAWFYRPIRLSISSLYVSHKGQTVWTSLRDDPAGPLGNADNTYCLLRDKLIDELSTK